MSDSVDVPSVEYVTGIEQELSKLALRVTILEDRLAKIGELLDGERCAG